MFKTKLDFHGVIYTFVCRIQEVKSQTMGTKRNFMKPIHILSGDFRQRTKLRNKGKDFCYQAPSLYFDQFSKIHCEVKQDFWYLSVLFFSVKEY